MEDFHKRNLKAARQVTKPDPMLTSFFRCLGIHARFHHQMADKTIRQAGENEHLAPYKLDTLLRSWRLETPNKCVLYLLTC